ncbi:MAG: GntR family transcriptional regulator [Syntrophobacteraceae bacterium]|nr:GntR family transcriptional regulator [Desulfobacteraceae bacterium]
MLNVISLREQVYQYLRSAIQKGVLVPGTSVKLENLAGALGISKTPLKEAILQLECEGFLEIQPRRGVLIKKLTYQEIKDYYEIIGSLESSVLLDVFDRLSDTHVREMKQSNAEQKDALESGDCDRYYRLNLGFHDVFLKLSANATMRRMVVPLKQRLYDIPQRVYWKDWEYRNMQEHARLIECIETGDKLGAVGILRDEHWGWRVHEPFITRFYAVTDAMRAPAEAASSQPEPRSSER